MEGWSGDSHVTGTGCDIPQQLYHLCTKVKLVFPTAEVTIKLIYQVDNVVFYHIKPNKTQLLPSSSDTETCSSCLFTNVQRLFETGSNDRGRIEIQPWHWRRQKEDSKQVEVVTSDPPIQRPIKRPCEDAVCLKGALTAGAGAALSLLQRTLKSLLTGRPWSQQLVSSSPPWMAINAWLSGLSSYLIPPNTSKAPAEESLSNTCVSLAPLFINFRSKMICLPQLPVFLQVSNTPLFHID